MTNTEKFILKDTKAKKAVTDILKIFDGESYQFANATLSVAKKYLNEESQFSAKSALNKINSLTDAEKPVKKK